VHYALRESCGELSKLSQDMLTDDTKVNEYADLFRTIKFVHGVHSSQEESVMFPYIRSVFPGSAAVYDEEHDRDHLLLEGAVVMVDRIEFLHRRLFGAERDISFEDEYKKLKVQLADATIRIRDNVNSHIDGEELHLSVVGRKYTPLKLQKQLVTSIFNFSPLSDWTRLIPFVMNYNYVHRRRVRFLTCLRWAVPERIQHIGKLVYEGVSPTKWDMLAADVPEMVPRHIAGYVRQW